jgi:GTP-binding protein
MQEAEIEEYRAFMEDRLQKKVLPISSVSGLNIDILKRIMFKTKGQKTNNE